MCYFVCSWKTEFKITDTKLMFLLTLSIKDNVKLLEQLESGFKWTID